MIPLQLLMFTLVAVFGTAVALTRDPTKQAVVLGFYGLLQAILFLVLHAPDVAFSVLVVGGAAVPLMLLVTISKIRERSK